MTVADILKAEPQSIGIFRKYRLDSSDMGGCQFEEACRKNSVDPHVVRKELINLRISLKETRESFGQFVESVLRQHEVIKDAIPLVRKALLHAIQHQKTYVYELLTVKTKFEILVDNLEVHLYKEEMILFPEFINLWNKKLYQTGYLLPFRMMHPIDGLEAEHESAKAILVEIRELIRYYKIPKYADKHYRNACLELESFERQMVKLIDQENRMLFPEALALERDFHK